MTSTARMSLGAALAALGVAAAGVLASAGHANVPVAPPLWGGADAAERDRAEALDARLDDIARRIDAKGRVVAAVREGRLTWEEGVGAFRDMIVADPELHAVLRDRFPGRSDAELAEENFLQYLSVPPATE